jgi:hypothetical protein
MSSFADLGYTEVYFLLFVRANLTMKVSFSMMNTSKDLDNLLGCPADGCLLQ